MQRRNLMKRLLLASGPALLLAALAPDTRAVTINIVFSDRWNDVNNWPGATPAERTANQGAATADMLQARDNWERAITDNFNTTVQVDWNLPFAYGNTSSNVCGVGGVDTSQVVGGVTKPSSGRIILNSSLNDWFFDPTPNDHEEFYSVPNEPWRGTSKPNGPAAGKEDLLSCAKHELGHALGFLNAPLALGGNGQFQPYINEVADGDIDVNDFGGIALNVGALGAINSASHFSPVGNVPDPALAIPVPMSHLLMVPEAPAGDHGRTVMSPYDISAAAKVLGLPLGVGYNLYPKTTIPEPASCTMALGLVSLALVGRRRR